MLSEIYSCLTCKWLSICLFLESFPKIKCIAVVAVETCSLYSKFSDWNPLSWCFVRWWMDWWIVKGWTRQHHHQWVVTTFSTEFIEGRDMEGWIIDAMNVTLQVYVQCHHRNYYKGHLSFVLFWMKTKRHESSLVVKELGKENESLCQKVFYCKRENYAALIFSSEFIIQFRIQHKAEHNTTVSEPTPAPAELSHRNLIRKKLETFGKV